FPKWYQDFATLIEPQPNMSHVVFDQSQSPFFDLLNTRYVLAHAEAPPPVGLQLIETAEGVSLYRNPSALPRAYIAPKATAVRNEAEARSKLSEAGFDPAQTVVLEDAGGSLLAPSGTVIDQASDVSGPIGSQSPPAVTLTEDRRNRVQI